MRHVACAARYKMHVIACPSLLRYTDAARILPPLAGDSSEGTRRHMPIDCLQRRPPTRAALRLFALAVLLAALGILLSMPRLPAAAAAPAAPAQRLDSSDPVIVWDSSMLFPGQNGGNPWGPVGEHARVQGQHFPDGHYNLVLAPGDVNSDATVCSSANPIPVPVTSGQVTASGGSFNATFVWPATANNVNTAYSICALNPADNTVASHLDSGPFTVLAANSPSLSVLTTSLTAGDSVNISGQNWVPEQPVLVFIAPCQSCDAQKTTSATVTSTGHNAGTFSVTLTVPASTAAGIYFLGAASTNGILSAAGQALTITVGPTATATATATATPAATATAVPGGGGGSPGSGISDGLVIGLVVAGVVLLALLAGVLAYLLTHRPAPSAGAGAAAGSGSAPRAYPTAQPYGAAPPPLPMPDELPGAWDPGATTATPSADNAFPANYDDPTDPGLGTPRDPRR
jgi:hypothetical protein